LFAATETRPERALVKSVIVLRHVAHEPMGTLEKHLGDVGLEYRYVDLFQSLPHRLPLDQAAALVVMGGPMNVDEQDQYPFLAAEVDWIRQAIQAETPVLGICLGAQLIAKSLGARVYANGVKEIGWYPLEVTADAADDRLFAGCQPVETVFQWHGDTFDLPAGATNLARSELCKHQAFRYGTSTYGLQFHVEVTPEIIDSWLAEPGNCGELSGLNYIDAPAIRAETPRRLPAMEALAGRLLPRFAHLAARRGR